MEDFDNNGQFDPRRQQDSRGGNGPYNNSYRSYNTQQQGYGEYSYQPPKQRKKSKAGVNALLAVLCVSALGVSSVVGWSLLQERTGIGRNSSISSPDRQRIAENSESDDKSSEKLPERDLNNLPTIETLAAPDDAMSIPDIVTKMSPSVVGISCITEGAQVSGTGIIMSSDGYIVTNAHVVNGASAISVVVTDKTGEKKTDDSSSKSVAEKILEKQNSSDGSDNNIEAELVGIDVQTDLAVLKISETDLTPAEFGTSSQIVVGELAIVIGNPLGFDLANTVTSGIISATDRKLTIEDRTMNLIQTDASINSGNSGGPLINAYGQVIGITSAKVASTQVEGLGFAIPIDEAKVIIDDLIRYGYVKGRPTLGISGQNISSFYAQYYGVPEGFIVRTVESGSAGENAGIRVNDIIVGIEGELVSTIEDFNEIKSLYKAGDTIKISVYRDDKIIDLDVTLDEAKNTESSASQNNGSNNGGYDDYYDYYDPWDYYR